MWVRSLNGNSVHGRVIVNTLEIDKIDLWVLSFDVNVFVSDMRRCYSSTGDRVRPRHAVAHRKHDGARHHHRHQQQEAAVRPVQPDRPHQRGHTGTGFSDSHAHTYTQGSHRTWKTWKNRARPGKPGKPGKTGGFWGKNLEKYYKTWKKIDLTPKKPKSLNRKKYLKKSNSRKRSQTFFFFLDRGLGIIGFCWNFKNVVLI